MKGFTLIELLAVLLIIITLAIITTVGITSIINSSKDSAYKTQVNNIISSTENWTIENVHLLPTDINESYELPLEELKKSGNLPNETIIDARTNEVMDGCIVITCASNCKQYKYTYEERSCN